MTLAVPHCPFKYHNTNHTPAQTIQAIEISNDIGCCIGLTSCLLTLAPT